MMKKEKLTFNFSLEKNEIKFFFHGRFDELLDGKEIATLIQKEYQKFPQDMPLVLYFSKVKTGNSLGIVELLKILKNLPMKKYIEEVPLWMV